MKLYIAGPMTGLPEFNFQAFAWAEQALLAKGLQVISPHTDVQDTTQSWSYYMKRAVMLMMQCDGVYALQGWQGSKGANLEVQLARELGMHIYIQGGQNDPAA